MPQKSEITSTRSALVRAGAWALLQVPSVAIALAGIDTVKFVNSARKSFRAAGFNFSDSDLRDMHYMIREQVAAMAARGELPVLDQLSHGQNLWTERIPPPKPEIIVTESDGSRKVIDKDRREF